FDQPIGVVLHPESARHDEQRAAGRFGASGLRRGRGDLRLRCDRLARLCHGFGVKDNADRLIERIKKAGFPAAGRVSTRNERTLTQVVAGPFDSSGRQRAALDAIRAMGVPDAIATKG
ncbi:MAG: SPOR domain-containing protein, partial [Pseudomonadota bacterium]